MAKIVTNDRNYYAIADAIREKLGTDDLFRPSEMAPAIRQISNAQKSIITIPLSVSKNGTYKTDSVQNAFDNIVVDVDTSVPREELIASRNGDYYPTEGALFSAVTVSVPVEYLLSDYFSTRVNGIYEPSDGYAFVQVWTIVKTYSMKSIDITRDGTYTPPTSGYLFDSVVVNVPSVDRTDFYSVFNQQEVVTVSNSELTKVRPYAFYQNSRIKAANFPNAKTIGSNAFYDCMILQSVSLATCSFISSGAFRECRSMKDLYLLSTAVVTINNYSDVFSNAWFTANSGYIYVPSNLLSAYKTHSQWGTISSRISAYAPQEVT